MKRIISVLLAAALLVTALLSFAACGERKNNLPIVCGESGMNSVCGVATYGVDYYSLGVKAADMAADILLDGKKASEMPVATDPNPGLTVNQSVAAEIGFTIPESVSSKATTASVQEVTRVAAAIKDDGADFVVGILQLMPHDALDKANKAFIDQLSVRMSTAGKTVKILNQNASGDESNNTTIASNFVDQNVNLIYTIATSSSQAAVSAVKNADKDIPVVFNAVTDPVDAGLVDSMDAPGKNVTGVSDMNPVKEQIDLIVELLGTDDVKIAFLYTGSETNSVFQINIAKAHCDEKGYKYETFAISDINDLDNTMVSLQKSGVDAIYIPTDNTIANAVASIHSLNLGK